MRRTSRRLVEVGPVTAARSRVVGVILCILGAASLICAVLVRGDADTRRLVPLSLPQTEIGATPWIHQRAAFAAKLRKSYGLNEETADEFAGWILEAGARQHLAPELLASLVMTESSFRKNVRSPMGAIGPAQVRADLWHGFCGGQLEDPEQNLYCGAQILAHYHEACALRGVTDDTESCALRSYNVGFGNHDNVYFLEAAARYISKIDRYRASLAESAETRQLPDPATTQTPYMRETPRPYPAR